MNGVKRCFICIIDVRAHGAPWRASQGSAGSLNTEVPQLRASIFVSIRYFVFTLLRCAQNGTLRCFSASPAGWASRRWAPTGPCLRYRVLDTSKEICVPLSLGDQTERSLFCLSHDNSFPLHYQPYFCCFPLLFPLDSPLGEFVCQIPPAMDFAGDAADTGPFSLEMMRSTMMRMMTDPASMQLDFSGLSVAGLSGPMLDSKMSKSDIAALKKRLRMGEAMLTHTTAGGLGVVFAGIPLPSVISAPLDEFDQLRNSLRLAGDDNPKIVLQDVMEAYPFFVPDEEPFPVFRNRHFGDSKYNHPDLRWLAMDRVALHSLSMLRHSDAKEDATRHAFTWAPEALLTGHPYLMLRASSCFAPPPFAASRDGDLDVVVQKAFQISHPRLLRLTQELHLQSKQRMPPPPPAESTTTWTATPVPDAVRKWLEGGPASSTPPQLSLPMQNSASKLPQSWEDCVHMLGSCLDRHQNVSGMHTWESSTVPFACPGHSTADCRRCSKLDKLVKEFACVSYEALEVCHVQTAHCCSHGGMVPLPTSDGSPDLMPRQQVGGQPSQVVFPQYSVTHNGLLIRLSESPFMDMLGRAGDGHILLDNVRCGLAARWNLTRMGQHLVCQAHLNAACAHLAAVGVPRAVAKAAVREALRRHIVTGLQRENQVLQDDACMVEVVAHLCDRRSEQEQLDARLSKVQRGILLRRDLLKAATAAKALPTESRQARSALNRVLALRMELGLLHNARVSVSSLMTRRGQALAMHAASGPVPPLTLLPEVTADPNGDMTDELRVVANLERFMPFFKSREPFGTALYGALAGTHVIGLKVTWQAAPLHTRWLLHFQQILLGINGGEAVGYRWLKSAADPRDPDGRGGFLPPLDDPQLVGPKMCYVPSLYHWGVIDRQACKMEGALFVPSGYENLEHQLPALVFRPGISGHLLHPGLLREDVLAPSSLTKMVFCAFHPLHAKGCPFLVYAKPAVQVADTIRSMCSDSPPPQVVESFERLLQGWLSPRTEVWMHQLAAESGVHLEPVLPKGPCYPFPGAPVPFPDLHTHAEHANEMCNFLQVSGCVYEKAGVEPTNYTVLDSSIQKDVFLGQYRCKTHGRIVPVQLFAEDGPSRKACKSGTEEWVRHSRRINMCTLGSKAIVLSGDVIATDDAFRAIFASMMQAAHAATKQGGSIWDEDAPVHPLAIFLELQVYTLQHRLAGLQPELNTFLRSMVHAGHREMDVIAAVMAGISSHAQRTVRWVEELFTPARCMKACKHFFSGHQHWEYFSKAGWPVYRQGVRNTTISTDLMQRMITSECHASAPHTPRAWTKNWFDTGRAKPYKAIRTAEFEARHRALWGLSGGGASCGE